MAPTTQQNSSNLRRSSRLKNLEKLPTITKLVKKSRVIKKTSKSPQFLEVKHQSADKSTTITTKIQKTSTNIKEYEIINKMQQEEEKLRQELAELNANYEIDRNYALRVKKIENDRNQEFVNRILYFTNHSRHYERIIGTWREISNVLTNRIGDADEDINFAERTLSRMVEVENDFGFSEE